jgi:hypothetical protein
MTGPDDTEAEIEAYVDELMKCVRDHLPELVRQVPDRANLVILGTGTVGKEAKFVGNKREDVLALFSGTEDSDAAIALERTLRSKSGGESLIPCVLIIKVVRNGQPLEVSFIQFALYGAQKGGDA